MCLTYSDELDLYLLVDRGSETGVAAGMLMRLLGQWMRAPTALRMSQPMIITWAMSSKT